MKARALLATSLVTGAAFASPAAAGDVEITITDLRSNKGVVRACMTTKEDIFPKCRKDPASYRTVVPAGKTVTIRFKDVKPGDYAIALLHDENDNGKADRALGMMPKEGYGFSRDAPVRMAPPKFKDAVFELGTGPKKMTIKMRYFL
ncbi:MAG: DUF2141 domain-containing protein [Pseudomonadota bacterium]